jgi:hypothetical protein
MTPQEEMEICLGLIGDLPRIREKLELMHTAFPNAFKKDLKKACNDFIAAIDKSLDAIYSDTYEGFVEKIKKRHKNRDKEYLRQLFKKDRVNQFFQYIYWEERKRRADQQARL